MERVFSVSEFIAAINDIVAGQFTVEGEVAGYSVSQGKWAFFSLKDGQSVLNCFAAVFRLPFPLEDGMQVRASGYPRVYERSGRFSLVVEYLELVGEGSLQRGYELLKKKLAAEGLFAPERKRSLPQFLRRVGVITSRDAAAWGDFKRILANRWSGVEVVLRHSLVQGEGAIEDIVQAFAELGRATQQLETIVLIRGGGSLEDLAAFNSEAVARAIYASPIPVLAGIGHERDETLADLVADVRASTPSNAAEILVPDRREFLRTLGEDLEFMTTQLDHILGRRRQSFEYAASRLASSAEMIVAGMRQQIEHFPRLLQVLETEVLRRADYVTGAERLLISLNPRQVLKRGYSITRRASGTVARDEVEIDNGEMLMIELQNGKIKAYARKD